MKSNQDYIFQGFDSRAQVFFADLAKHNDKAWFNDNKSRYENEVLHPAAAFVLEMGRRLRAVYPDISYGTQRNGGGSIMRIYRDLRFSQDKRPYKENLGIIFPLGVGKKVEQRCFYFHLDTQEVFFYAGQHCFPKILLGDYRDAVVDEKKGQALQQILDALLQVDLAQMETPALKRVPRGYAPDHPRAELLRLNGLGVARRFSIHETASPGFLEDCANIAVQVKPLMDWLAKLN